MSHSTPHFSHYLRQWPEQLLADRSLEYPYSSAALPSVQASAVKPHQEPITPVPIAKTLDERKVALGRQLFHDPRLSRNNQVSCASCHEHSLGGADGRAHSIGIEGRLVAFNAPTVWNSSLNFRQFWDGRSISLAEQVDGPLLDPLEMDTTWPEVIAKLRQDSDYANAFRQLYAEGVQPDAVRDAIATYEQNLVTPNARFDQYLKGDTAILSAEEKAGYERFKSYGCVACHQGVNVGGNMFQRLGVIEDFFLTRESIEPSDLGRMNITGRARDRYVFKVPGLRNVALTAPSLHDGSVETLEDTVSIMTRYQLGRDIPSEDIDLIVKFLNTLTGDPPEAA
ncbi:MAG: cytochrome c peroxidase [Cyanobacteria bacterium J06632_3]